MWVDKAPVAAHARGTSSSAALRPTEQRYEDKNAATGAVPAATMADRLPVEQVLQGELLKGPASTPLGYRPNTSREGSTYKLAWSTSASPCSRACRNPRHAVVAYQAHADLEPCNHPRIDLLV